MNAKFALSPDQVEEGLARNAGRPTLQSARIGGDDARAVELPKRYITDSNCMRSSISTIACWAATFFAVWRSFDAPTSDPFLLLSLLFFFLQEIENVLVVVVFNHLVSYWSPMKFKRLAVTEYFCESPIQLRLA